MIGLRRLVGQLFLEDDAKQMRRGMEGVVYEGRYASGRAYGYRTTPGRSGVLRIESAEATIMRRIFEEFATGELLETSPTT